MLRAASSEVESYERIELTGVPETRDPRPAVTDVVHLLAELLENATTFSSPQTKVRVTATRLPDGRVVVEIHDKGIGLTAEDFADINHKLANPPTVDAAFSQRMGLFVVGRLADRHGIRVQLRPSGEAAGTTSLVMLPAAITHGGGGEDPAGGGLHGLPDHPRAGLLPDRTAAYGGRTRLRRHPVRRRRSPASRTRCNRSLIREERRAVLGAQASAASRPRSVTNAVRRTAVRAGRLRAGRLLAEQYQQPQQDPYVQAQRPPRASYEQGRYATPDDRAGDRLPDPGFPAVRVPADAAR